MIVIGLIDDLWCPIVYCDKCGERIEDARTAMVAWEWEDAEARTIGKLAFLHKDVCDDRSITRWMELEKFIMDLKFNTKCRSIEEYYKNRREQYERDRLDPDTPF